MPIIDLKLDGDGAFPDLADRIDGPDLWYEANAPIAIAYLDHGMRSGKPSLVIRTNYSDGRVALVETSVELFLASADAIRAWMGR